MPRSDVAGLCKSELDDKESFVDGARGTLLLILALSSLVGACASTVTRETVPARSATEQLLISAAADDAARRMNLDIPSGYKAYVDAINFEGTDEEYAISAIKEAFLQLGVRLARDRSQADAIIEIRSGALSINQTQTVLGLPATNLGLFTTPEASFYSANAQEAVAKFAAFAYDADTGEHLASTGPVYGISRRQGNRVLSTFSWEDEELYSVRDAPP